MAGPRSYMSELEPSVDAGFARDIEAVENRILWLSSLIIHEANKRKDSTGTKVGGHQASTASCVSILTSLYFNHLTSSDRIAVKPHASPALYAIQYLLGNVPRDHLTRLREFDGLQAYPSQTKNPEFVDYSTGSVGLGAAAVNFSALSAEYLRSKDLLDGQGNFWAVIGDAELDEGNVWEALAEPLLDGVPGIRWVIDLNRQSLDRVVPGLRVRRLERLFEANNWRVIQAKYGRALQAMFAEPGGDVLRSRIDEMPNEEYQSIISGPADEARERVADASRQPSAIRALFGEMDDRQVLELVSGLGGHDQDVLKASYEEADSESGPAVIFAYTVKGWNLPFAGDPFNHSAVMSDTQMQSLARRLDIGDDWFQRIEADDVGAELVSAARKRLVRTRLSRRSTLKVPTHVDARVAPRSSSQEAFGRVLAQMPASAPEVAERIVTVAPDVSISTNLAGWINKVGSWNATSLPRFGAENPLLRWSESPDGQHLELGISEMNLFGLLGQLGLSLSTFETSLIPVGTVYDTFISRGLDAFVYGLYSGSSFVLVGTPSGVTLAPEGGAHQSTFTPGLGISLPGLVSYEPCFAKETEWVMLEAFERALRGAGSTYLRLSTLPVDQSLFPGDSEARRASVVDGAYRIVDRRLEPNYSAANASIIFATGVTVPNALAASEALLAEGVFASVINVTSADRLFRKWTASARATIETARHQPNPFPNLVGQGEVGLPTVSVADGHPHNLAFLGTALGVPSVSLGVSTFGESGAVEDLHRKHHLDPASLVNAVLSLVDRRFAGGG